MNELSLFTGAGGGIWGSKLLGWRTIGYVERDRYCCDVIERRIKDRLFSDAPVFQMDVGEFNEKVAPDYAGMVDVITAGFPCQPFSVAGKGQAEDDTRNCWPQTIEAIRIIRPRYAFLENVPGLLAHRYFGRILGDLAESGYDARWCIVSAQRKSERRTKGTGSGYWPSPQAMDSISNQIQESIDRIMNRPRQGKMPPKLAVAVKMWPTPNRSSGTGAGEHGTGGPNLQTVVGGTLNPTWVEWLMNWPLGSTDLEPLAKENFNDWLQGQHSGTQTSNDVQSVMRESSSMGKAAWWDREPNIPRVATGVKGRVARLKALGNGQVPLVVKTAWERLTNERDT